MIALQDRQLVYEFLILDLAIRSLQHDLEKIGHLKFAELYSSQLSGILKQNSQQLIEIKLLPSMVIPQDTAPN